MEMEVNKTREQWYDELFDGACVSNSRARVERRLAIIDAIRREAKVEQAQRDLRLISEDEPHGGISDDDEIDSTTRTLLRKRLVAEINRLKKGSQ
jgi:hypothetical protein